MNDTAFEALKLKIMADVTGTKKTTSSGIRYSFISYSQLVADLRSTMIKHGMTVKPCGVTMLDRSTYTTKNGATMLSIVCQFDFAFMAAGITEYVTVIAEASDSSDKAASKASTQGMKYALRQFFLLEYDEDDPDRARPERASVREANLRAALEKASTPEEIEKIRAAMEDQDFVTFTPEQREKLRSEIHTKQDQISATKTTPRKRTPKPQKEEGAGDS